MTYAEQYRERIQRIRPVLKRITFCPCSATKAEQILAGYRLDDVRTLQVIMTIGRRYKDIKRRKPVKNPDKVFKSWDDYLGFDACANVQNEIDYLFGKNDWQSWLKYGMRVLSITV